MHHQRRPQRHRLPHRLPPVQGWPRLRPHQQQPEGVDLPEGERDQPDLQHHQRLPSRRLLPLQRRGRREPLHPHLHLRQEDAEQVHPLQQRQEGVPEEVHEDAGLHGSVQVLHERGQRVLHLRRPEHLLLQLGVPLPRLLSLGCCVLG